MTTIRLLLALLCLASAADAQRKLWLGEAATIKAGPFVDDADGTTLQTGLTITQAEVRLSKNGGDIAQKNQSSSATHDELGIYDVSLNAIDTNTAGTLEVYIYDAGSLIWWDEYEVAAAEPGKLYVSKSGSDSNNGYSWGTAKLTLPAAKTAASAGTTIHVGPGTYTLAASDNLAKAGVSWHGDTNAHITSPDAISAERWIFDDGGDPMTFSVTGFGSITSGDGSAGSHEGRAGILKTADPDSVVTLNVARLVAYDNQLFGPTGTIATCEGGVQFITAKQAYGSNEVIHCDGGLQFITVEHFDKTPGSSFDQTAFLCDDGEQHIRVDRVAGLTGDTFHANATGKQFITAGDVEGVHDSLTCIGVNAVQHATIRRLTGGIYHAGGDQRVHVDSMPSAEYCVYLTGTDAGTLTVSGGAFTADTGDAAIDVRTTNANRRVVLLGGSFKGPTNAISAVAAVTQTVEIHGPVTFDGAIDSDVTISSATRQVVRAADLSANQLATAAALTTVGTNAATAATQSTTAATQSTAAASSAATAVTQATAAATDTATLTSRLTSGRAAKLDSLLDSGSVASSAEVGAIEGGTVLTGDQLAKIDRLPESGVVATATDVQTAGSGGPAMLGQADAGFVVEAPRRNEGVLVADQPIYLSYGEAPLCGLSIAKQFPTARFTAMEAPVSADPTKVTVSAVATTGYGAEPQVAKFKPAVADEDVAANSRVRVSFFATTAGGGRRQYAVDIVVKKIN
jgi:hypothetical protein